jgi:hypothetical protein
MSVDSGWLAAYNNAMSHGGDEHKVSTMDESTLGAVQPHFNNAHCT